MHNDTPGLGAERGITRLFADYAWHIDHGATPDADAVSMCFAPDGRWISDGLATERVGRESIRALFGASLPEAITQGLHYITNVRVDLDAETTERAWATAYLATFCFPVGDVAAAGPMMIASSYAAQVEMHDGRWLFSELRITRQYASAPTKGWA